MYRLIEFEHTFHLKNQMQNNGQMHNSSLGQYGMLSPLPLFLEKLDPVTSFLSCRQRKMLRSKLMIEALLHLIKPKSWRLWLL